MDTILLMLSGGIDSTYLLHYYLTQTKHLIHVHHISQRYPQFDRWKQEDPAVQNIIAYCVQNYRDFDYSESRFDMECMNLVGPDLSLQLLVASKVGPNLPGEKITLALGHCAEDFDNPEHHERAKQQGVWPSLWAALCQKGHNMDKLNPDIAAPSIDMTKEDLCRNVPHDLLRLCWSCRMPKFIGDMALPCGFCKTCKSIEQALSNMGKAKEYPNLVRQRKSSKDRTKMLNHREGRFV